MDDIVTRLRAAYKSNTMGPGDRWNLHDEAADEIESLRADAERYRRLGWLIDDDAWTTLTCDHDDIETKEQLDRLLDSLEIIVKAEASRKAIEREHSEKEG